MTAGPATRPRRGFVLPFVVLALAASSLFALAFAGEVWQALRAARSAVASDDAGHRAEAALSRGLATWLEDSLWTEPPGFRHLRTLSVDAEPVTVEWQRHQPLVWTLRGRAGRAGARRLDRSVREHLRAVWLDAPPLPVVAMLATSGGVRGAEGTLISGGDLPVPGSPCGTERDTASVPSVVAARVSGMMPGSWPGAPASQLPPVPFAQELETARAEIASRLPAIPLDGTPRPLPVHLGWRALRITAPSGLVLTGGTGWQGLLVVDGDVTVAGPVRLAGVLVVHGRLDALAAPLTVHGAVVVADTTAQAVTLGHTGRLFYDRCAVQMALATVARPTLVPFARWTRLAH